MNWSGARQAHPARWLIIEALEAHTVGEQRILDKLAVIETCANGASAMQAYERWHQAHPLREFYFVHTGREELDIRERRWIGIRRNDAAYAQTTPGGHRTVTQPKPAWGVPCRDSGRNRNARLITGRCASITGACLF